MKQPRRRVEPNLYQYPDGRYEARVSAAGRVAPATRFPADTPLEQIRTWIADAKRRLTKEARELGDVPQAGRGTLEGDAPDFLAQIAGRVSTKADTSHLRAWFDVVIDGVRLGSLPRSAITTGHINKTIAAWQTQPSPHAIRRVRTTGYTRKGRTIATYERKAPTTSGHVVSALTIRHRCRVLHDCYRTLDGPEARSPVAHAKIPTRGKRPPVTVPTDLVGTVLHRLRPLCEKTFARFYVACTTGQRPCQIGRAMPDDVQLADRSWLVRDAKGEPAHTVSLDKPQLAAWQAFIEAEAWGAFDTTRYGRLIHAAGWPKGIKPYAARHSFAREAIRRGVSLGDVQALLGHLDPATTRIYAPFVMDRQREVSKAMASYLADVTKPRRVK